MAIDGLCLDLPDTPGNAAEFGYPGNGTGRGPFPQIRVVGAGECGTRAVLGAELSPLATGEQALARQLLTRLRPGDLLAADRNFLSHGLLAEVLAAGVHVLWRAKSDVGLPVLEVLADGTWLSRIADPAASRKMRRKGASGVAVTVSDCRLPVAAAEFAVAVACAVNEHVPTPRRRTVVEPLTTQVLAVDDVTAFVPSPAYVNVAVSLPPTSEAAGAGMLFMVIVGVPCATVKLRCTGVARCVVYVASPA